MQLGSRAAVAAVLAIAPLFAAGVALAEDRVDATTTWYQEKRRGGLGGLTVIHPQVDLGVDLGDLVELGAGYSADIVSGATAAVYKPDAVSTATTLEDTRHAGSLSLGFSGSRAALAFSGSVATERDYLSIAVGGSGEITLPGKNTTVRLGYTHSFDQVCDKDNSQRMPLERLPLSGFDPCTKNVLRGEDTPGTTVWRDLAIDTVQGTITQNLSPTMVGQVSVFGQVLRGFQSNPYRRVQIGAAEPQELVPDVRARLAVLARLNRFIPALRSAIHASLRGYSDTWGVNSATAELGYSQYLAQELLVRFRARVYQQTEATFFKDAFFYQTESSAGAYFTGDRELGRIRDAVVGGQLTFADVKEDEPIWGVFDELRLSLKADVFFFQELPADDLSANLAGIDDQYLSSNQLLDAFVLQLGLLLAY